jgi:hypothetical protein
MFDCPTSELIRSGSRGRRKRELREQGNGRRSGCRRKKKQKSELLGKLQSELDKSIGRPRKQE